MPEAKKPNANKNIKHPAARRAPAATASKRAVAKKPFADVANDKGENFTLGSVKVNGNTSLARRRREPIYHDVKTKKKAGFPAVTVFFMLICTLLVMFMIINYVQINEYTHEIADMKGDLEKLQTKERELTLELEEKNDQRSIEAKASELGMVSSDQLRRVYIDIENEDKIDNYEDDNEDRGVIATVLNALGENMRTYWNIFAGAE